jgi:surfactin synthase thioesterase subunit
VASYPLVLIHHAGGSAAVFRPLVRALPPCVTAKTVELPGRGRLWRQRAEVDIEAAVDRLVESTEEIDGEFAIFGHSLGAYLGLALAARLESAAGQARCAVLFASANAAPSAAVLPFDDSPLGTSDAEIFKIAQSSGGGVAPQFAENEQLRARIAALLRADFSLSHTFLGTSRQVVTGADVIACYGTADIFTDSQVMAWSRHTSGGFEAHRFSGGHFYLEEEGDAVAGVIATVLARYSR